MGVVSDLGISSPQASRLHRAVRWCASTVVGARVLSRLVPGLDSAVMTMTRGRGTSVEALAGLPTVSLTTRGAKTGLARTVPLVAVVDGDDVAVIGSNWGRPHHPAWVHNLIADPHATVSWRGRSADVVAREVTGHDAERIWQRARAIYRGFRTYPTRTQGRTIRVFVLETSAA
jgi:deazaflavin-dependent oxidoreductase (nitroreductase family)